MDIYYKQTKNQMSKDCFVLTNNESMTWTTNYNESLLGPLKGKLDEVGVNMLQAEETVITHHVVENLE